MTDNNNFSANCPLPLSKYSQVMLAHGGGGKLMQQLIDTMFGKTFANPLLDMRHDGALLEVVATGDISQLAFTTDSYVVRPLFFPGGDIGSMAVNGTVNDLAMCGARPLYLSAAFIIEEGLAMATLWRIVQSMQQAANFAKVQIVTGDTKVVDKGKGDGLFINTSGIGIRQHAQIVAPTSIQVGDVIILSGDIGRHGIAVMAERENMEFESTIESDCAPVAEVVQAMLQAGIEIHCLRDLTRGGLASALVEIATTSCLQLHIEENAIPVHEQVEGACEILGLNPLYVANEGCFVSFIPPEHAKQALQIMHTQPVAQKACVIGKVQTAQASTVTMKSKIGVNRIIDMLSGEQLPRIC